MNIHTDMVFVTVLFLISIRLSALFLLTPLFSVAQIPVRIRVIFLLVISFVLTLSLESLPTSAPDTLGKLISASLYELVLGALMAFGIFTAFGAFLFGGRVLDFQMGFGVANLIDPATNTQNPLIGSALNFMAVATFYLLDGHHMILRGLSYSLKKVPPGIPLGEINMEAIIMQFGHMFIFGLAVVAPAVMALLLLDAGMAIAARTMPQVNMFIVGLPLKIFVGLMILAYSINYLGPLLTKVYESIFRYWENILA